MTKIFFEDKGVINVKSRKVIISRGRNRQKKEHTVICSTTDHMVDLNLGGFFFPFLIFQWEQSTPCRTAA